MGYVGDSPFGVPVGGTGVTSITANNILAGNGVSPIGSITAGSNGQLLRGNTSSAPTFSNTNVGGFNFSTSSVGAAVAVICTNSDNTNTGSNSTISMNVGGTSGGDPVHQYIVPGVTTWTQGTDNSDSDIFKINPSASLGSGDVMTMTNTGLLNFPLNSCFLAYLDTPVLDVTGAGGTYVLGTTGGQALVEVFDQHGDFNTNGTFTAPITGRYDLRAAIYASNITIATSFQITLVTSNRSYSFNFTRAALATDQSSFISAICDMDAGDTATVNLVINGEGADDCSVTGSALLVSYFCGTLAA